MPRSLARDKFVRHLIEEVDELRSRYNTCTDYGSALAPQYNMPELRNANVPLMGGAAPADRNSVEGLRSAMNTLAANLESLTTQMEGVCGAVNKLADSISDLVVALGAVQAPVGMTNTPPVDVAAVPGSNSAEGSGMRPFSIRVPPCATTIASVRNERRASCSVPPFSVGRFNEGPAAQTSRSPANQSLSGAQQPLDSLSNFQWQHSSHADSPETSSSSAGSGPVDATPSPLLHCATATGASDKPLPTPGLFIPDVPVRNPDGGRRAKSESWRDIVKHWNEGDPALGLHTPLKDWHSDWTRGNNRLFASKYQQRSVIALEFINRLVYSSSHPIDRCLPLSIYMHD